MYTLSYDGVKTQSSALSLPSPHLQAPIRDHMLAQFTSQASSGARTPEELVKLKCKLVSNFSLNLSRVFSSLSLRSQIMRHYRNILQLLDDFHTARESHFVLGRQIEFGLGSRSSASVGSNSSLRSLQLNPGGMSDPRQHLARPFALLSSDGQRLMNMWYIPHYTEVGNLSVFNKSLDLL